MNCACRRDPYLTCCLLEGGYGSLQADRLEALERRLVHLVEQADKPQIEIDLALALNYGSGLVNVLLKALEIAKRKGKLFRVVGDHAGVLKMLKLESVLGAVALR